MDRSIVYANVLVIVTAEYSDNDHMTIDVDALNQPMKSGLFCLMIISDNSGVNRVDKQGHRQTVLKTMSPSLR